MVNLAVIGTGGMAAGHARSFSEIKGCNVIAACDIDKKKVAAFAETHGIEKTYVDYKELLKDKKLDAVTIVTNDATHVPISLASLKAGKHVLCEKPLATNLADAKKAAKAAKKSGLINMVNFSKRNSSGLQKAAELIKKGEIGRVMHVEASYFQEWLSNGAWKVNPALTWRLNTEAGSTGVMGDLGCHIYDMSELLCGDFKTIDCRMKTFKKNVKNEKFKGHKLDANDSFLTTVEFGSGALGSIQSSRWASGFGNREYIRVFGDDGHIEVDFGEGIDCYKIYKVNKTRPIFAATGKMKTVKCKKTPTNYERFIKAIKTGKNDVCDFENGAKIQAYLHYSFESDKKKGPVKVR
ncbi:MAG: Gfo/Idh/MocA family protein [Planctomycetota bacterium]